MGMIKLFLVGPNHFEGRMPDVYAIEARHRPQKDGAPFNCFAYIGGEGGYDSKETCDVISETYITREMAQSIWDNNPEKRGYAKDYMAYDIKNAPEYDV